MTTRWTTPADVIDRWSGPGAPTDNDLLTALILDAEAVILAEYPRIQERIDAEALDVALVTLVTSRMVSRLLRNPEGLSYWQQTTGPFGQARNFGDQVDIWLTADERKLLAPQARGKAFSVNIAPDAAAPTTDPLWEPRV